MPHITKKIVQFPQSVVSRRRINAPRAIIETSAKTSSWFRRRRRIHRSLTILPRIYSSSPSSLAKEHFLTRGYPDILTTPVFSRDLFMAVIRRPSMHFGLAGRRRQYAELALIPRRTNAGNSAFDDVCTRAQTSLLYYCPSRLDRVPYNVDKISVRSWLYDNRKMSFTAGDPRYSLPANRSLRRYIRYCTLYNVPFSFLFFFFILFSIRSCDVPACVGKPGRFALNFVRTKFRRSFVQA